MSIYAYVGLPGSGKSYDVVANQILPALKAGRIVVTNVPLNMDAVRALVPDADVREFPTEQVAAQPEMIESYAVPGCLLVLDEVWKLFPSGQKVDRVPGPYKKLLAEHRHMVDARHRSMQIVLVTQDLAQISAFAKVLIEQTFNHTKLTHVGLGGSYRIDVYHGPRTADKMPKEARLQEVFGTYKKEVFDLYQSHTMRETPGSGANEKPLDRRGVIWKRPGLLIAGGICVVVIWWAVPTLAGMISGGPDSVVNLPGQKPETRSAPVTSPIRIDAPAGRWRVVSVTVSEDSRWSFAVVEDAAGGTVEVPLSDCQRPRIRWRCSVAGQWAEFKPVFRPPAENKPSVLSVGTDH